MTHQHRKWKSFTRAHLLLLCLSLFSVHAIAQTDNTDAEAITPSKVKTFYQYFVPGALNGSSIAPAAISSFNVGLGDDKTSFKYGRAFKRANINNKDKTDDDALKNSFSFTGTLKAVDGIGTLYKKDATLDYSIGAGLTYVTVRSLYVYKGTDERSTEHFQWVNIMPQFGQSKLNIFSGDTTFAKKTSSTYSIMANYNFYWHSAVKGYRKFNGIYSAGVGYGKINNYKTLSEITRQTGVMTPNGATSYFSRTDEVAGRKGDFREYHAFLYHIDVYRALVRRPNVTCYVGGRYSGALGQVDIANATGGFYLSFRDAEKKEEKFGFSLTGNIENLQGVKGKNEFNDKFYVAIAASIPLTFNLEKK